MEVVAEKKGCEGSFTQFTNKVEFKGKQICLTDKSILMPKNLQGMRSFPRCLAHAHSADPCYGADAPGWQRGSSHVSLGRATLPPRRAPRKASVPGKLKVAPLSTHTEAADLWATSCTLSSDFQ